jgi:hypothetical protein
MNQFDTPLFTLEDVKAIRKDVSTNIDDFDQYASEVQRNYLSKLIGDKLYNALVTTPTEERMVKLLDGEVYQDGGRDVIYRGVKLYLVYAWLYVYSLASSISLTPTGSKIFKDQYAEEARDRKANKDNYMNYIASVDGMEEPIMRYLDKNRDIYEEYGESLQIKQASSDNIRFKVRGRTYRRNINNTM